MKRWIWPIMVCLSMGVVTTIAVAWGVSFFSDPQSVRPFVQGQIDYQGGQIAVDVYGHVAFREARNGFRVHRLTIDLPHVAWGESLLRNAEPMPDGMPPLPTARGFPMLAMGCLLEEYRQGTVWTRGVRGGIPLEEATLRRHGRVLPFTPIFPGFIINTLFYAAIWFTLIFGWRAHRRLIRRWQGYCPMCTYDLRGDVSTGCPECGWGRAGG